MALSDVQLLDFLSRMPFIDTVLVVADSLTYSAPEARRVLARIHRRTPMDGVRAAEGGG